MARTKIDKLEDEAGERQASARVAAALFEGLNKEPENWDWNEDIVDMGPDGKCLCGHRIRNGYPLHHKTNNSVIRIVGSSCVHYFKSLNPELYAHLLDGIARIEKQIREAKAASKKAAAMADVEVMRERYKYLRDAAKDIYLSFKEMGRHAPRDFWEAFASYTYPLPSKAPQYTRPSDFKRWYGDQIKRVEGILTRNGYHPAVERQEAA